MDTAGTSSIAMAMTMERERKITHYKKIKELVGWVVDNKSVFN